MKALLEELEDLLMKSAALKDALPPEFEGRKIPINNLDQSDLRTKLMANQQSFNSILLYGSMSAAICHMHIFCSSIITYQSLRDGYNALGQVYPNFESNVNEKMLVTDICRSVWQFLVKETKGQRGLLCVEDSAGIRGRFLFWPLKVAGFSAESTPSLISRSQIRFLNNVISYLEHEQGIPQAREFLIEVK